MARIMLLIALAAASLAAKDRAWQSGQLLDKDLNPYIKVAADDNSVGRPQPTFSSANSQMAVSVNVNQSNGDVAYDDYVIEAQETVYLVEFARLKSYKAAHLSLSRPLSFAVEKNKLWIKDLDGNEFGTQILKQVQKDAPKKGDIVAAVAVPAKVESKPAPAAPVIRASLKDRAWQGGQLLSIADNGYFANATYSSDSANSPYTYDNYVIESQFCVYLVQRMRPKTSAPARLPGAAVLKFAVEKNKLWVLDQENTEYETKVVKLAQKDESPIAASSPR